jgi:hypothetical protein
MQDQYTLNAGAAPKPEHSYNKRVSFETRMNLEERVQHGWLRREPTSPREIKNLPEQNALWRIQPPNLSRPT